VVLQTTQKPDVTYTWRRWANVLPGVSGTQFTATEPGDYTVVATNSYGCTHVSDSINVNFASQTVSISALSATNLCFGDSLLLKTVQTPGASYTWKKNGIPIPGATGTSVYATTSGSYKCVLTYGPGCSRPSNAIEVNMGPDKPMMNLTGTIGMCPGDSLNLNITPVNGWSYQWMKYKVAIPGAITNRLTVSEAGRFKCQVTDLNGCTRISPPVDLIFNCREVNNGRDNLDKKVMIFPNPQKSNFLVVSEVEVDNISVTDINGRQVDAKILMQQDNSYIVTGMEDGTYIFRVSTEAGVREEQVILASDEQLSE